jgi:hypothetical protein
MLAKFISYEGAFMESDKSESLDGDVTLEVDTTSMHLNDSLHFTMTYENGAIKDEICASFGKKDIIYLKGVIDTYLESLKEL